MIDIINEYVKKGINYITIRYSEKQGNVFVSKYATIKKR